MLSRAELDRHNRPAGGKKKTMKPSPLSQTLRSLTAGLTHTHYQLVVAAADFADSDEWARDGSPTAAHWLAAIADVETCTAREWVRVGRALRSLHASADAFANGKLSYAKIRTLTRFATQDNETELLELAMATTANHLPRALAAWLNRTSDPADLEAHQHAQRSLSTRLEPDGTTTFTLKAPPHLAGLLHALLAAIVMRSTPKREPDGTWPTLAQQHADALGTLLTQGAGGISTELVLHVRGDGCTLDNGTPIPDTVIERIAPTAFLRALIHDADNRPVNVSHRRRHPTTRQKRLVKERDRACIDCGREQLLEYDHNPPYEHTHRTITNELELRCAPCHRRRHAAEVAA